MLSITALQRKKKLSLSSMASAIKKANVIKQIVRLRHFVNRGKSRSIHGGSDEPGGTSQRTPSGSVAVYVGSERRRFVIPTRFLNLPVFVDLLEQAEEEFGYQHTGGLSLPCEADFFGEIVCLLEEDEDKCRGLRMEEFAKMVSEMRFHSNDCRESSSAARLAVTPLLQKTRV